MKLLSLSLQNLASISAPVTINFNAEPLASAGIFAITGKTGSGKSTLLDAICLALYATTPRYERYSQRKGVEQMLHKGAQKGYARVTFESVQGEVYEAEWRIAKKRVRKVVSDKSDVKIERHLRRVADDTIIADSISSVSAELPELLGLTYDQFTRSVMLAQGEFTSFLKADAGTKATLLEKLTGTDLYGRVSVEVHERSTFETARLKTLLDQKGSIEILSDEAREALTTQLTQEAAAEENLRRQEKEIDRQLLDYASYNGLKTGVAEAREQHMLVQASAADRDARASRLALAEAATAMRDPMREIAEAAELLEASHLHLEGIQKEEAEIGEQQAEVAFYVEERKAAVAALDREGEALQPQIKEARRQDTNLLVLEERARTAGTRAIDLAKEAAEATTVLVQQKALVHKYQSEEKILVEWLQKKELHRELFEANAQVQQLLREREAYEKASVFATHMLSKAAKEVANIQAEVTAGNTRIAEAETDFNAQLAALYSSGIQLTKEEILAGRGTDDLETAQKLWKVQQALWISFEAALESSDKEAKALSGQEQTILKAAANSTQKTATREKSEVLKRETAQRLAALKLAYSNTVVELRNTLCAGEACPVCGSKAHPAAEIELGPINDLMASHENEAANAQIAFEEALRAEATAQTELATAQRNLRQAEEAAQNAKNLAVQKEANWTQNATSEEKKTPAENRRIFYESLLTQNELRRKAFTTAERSLHTLESIKATQNLLLQKEHNAVEKRASVKEQQAAATNALQENEKALDLYFASPRWKESWRKNGTSFAAELAKTSREWKEKKESLSLLKGDLRNAEQQLERDFLQHQKATTAAATATELLNDAQEAFSAAQLRRQKVLGGLGADIAEAQFAERRNNALVQLGVGESTATRLANALRDLLKDRDGTRRQQIELQQKEKRAGEKIAYWLSTQSAILGRAIFRTELEVLIQTEPVQLLAERNALATLKETLQNAQVRLEEREASLEKAAQKLGTATEEELLAAGENLRAQREAYAFSRATLNLQLAQDNSGRNQLGDLLYKLEKQDKIAGRWQKLKELIGSSDGKAFRSIAQEYTLDILLVEANLQLLQLAPRYRLLRAGGTLDLQIIDGDMGNEVRTVHSISGGESFLVSLSLALGLAALSAGRQLVECLFIDEGFGMLDPATLHLALDALETLQQQGRKIGVISHIKEMTDRIPVQIQVKKKSNGRSSVVVEGNLSDG